MNRQTNLTAAMIVEAAVSVIFLICEKLGAPLGSELESAVSVVALGIALYYLPADFPLRKKDPHASS